MEVCIHLFRYFFDTTIPSLIYIDTIASFYCTADKNQSGPNGATPLYVAAWNGYLPLVKYLVGEGVIINKSYTGGVTPLDAAIIKQRTEIEEYLRQQGGIQSEDCKREMANGFTAP